MLWRQLKPYCNERLIKTIKLCAAKALVAAQAYHLQQQRLAAAQTVAPSMPGVGSFAGSSATGPLAMGTSSSSIVKNPIVTVGMPPAPPLSFARAGLPPQASPRGALMPGQQLLPYTGQATRAQLATSGVGAGAAGSSGGATLMPGAIRPALIPNAAQTLNIERLIEEQLRPDNWVSIFPTSSDLLRNEHWESRIIFDALVSVSFSRLVTLYSYSCSGFGFGFGRLPFHELITYNTSMCA